QTTMDCSFCHHCVCINLHAPAFVAAVVDPLSANCTAVLRVNNGGHDHSYTDRTDALSHSVRAWLICVAAPASVPKPPTLPTRVRVWAWRAQLGAGLTRLTRSRRPNHS